MSIFNQLRGIPDQMNADEALAHLKRIARDSHGDAECDHDDADNVLLALLRHHGHTDIVDAWQAIEKWYS